MARLTLSRPGVVLHGESVGSGPPAVLLHAGGESRSVWDPVAAALEDAGCSSVAFDLRGHGDSAEVPADRLDHVAADVPGMVDAARSAPVLVGASLGGPAAILALADRDLERRTAGLVLVDVVPDPPPARTRAWLTRNAGSLADVAIVDDILARGPQLRSIAAGLELPVLMVRGGRSPLGDADFDRFAELVPRGKVAWIPEAGHLVARDAPIPLARIVAAFLGDRRVRRRRGDDLR